MTTNAQVAIGLPMPPDVELAHKLRLAEIYADQADQAVDIIEAKLAGTQEALEIAKSEAERLRDELEHLRIEAEEGGQA